MPNRIIKESICTSSNLNNLSPQEEIFFYRIMVNCDDYGRMDARPSILRSRCFPLRVDKIKDADVEKWLHTLITQKLVQTYNANGNLYLFIYTWDKHQQIRAKRSKYPDPKDYMQTSDSIGNQLPANVTVIQSESNPNPNPIYMHWNSKNIIVHKKETELIKDKINANLKVYSEDEIIKAIDNYAAVLNDSDSYFKHKWTLIDFLQRGLEKFLDSASPLVNFKKDKQEPYHGAHKRLSSREPPTHYTDPDVAFGRAPQP